MRTQSAQEFLLSHAWMIILVIMVGAVLYTLGVFNPQEKIIKRQKTGFDRFEIVDWTLNSTGHFRIIIGNKYGKIVSLDTPPEGIGVKILNKAGIEQYYQDLKPGKNADITIYIGETKVDWYEAELNITYTDIETGLMHTEKGLVKDYVV